MPGGGKGLSGILMTKYQ